MIYVFYSIHVIVCLFLILVVLLQQGKGADLSVFGGGSTQTAFGARGAATLLHKLTVVSFVLFILTTLSIAVLKSGSPGGGSVVDDGGEEPDAFRGEICNGLDDDGDGRVDETCGCSIGDTQSCYPGDPSLGGVGTCALGSQTCVETSGEFGMWGTCSGAAPPEDEVCDGRDNDCDGTVDDGCECDVGDTRDCYEGPPGTEGTRRCNHGRLCATLTAAGREVGAIMIAEGLARRYVCGATRCPPRGTWC